MSSWWICRVAVCFWLGVACLLAGCEPEEVRGAKLKGKVLKNGQPLKPLAGEHVWVTFEHVESGAGRQVIMTSGQMQKDGTFALVGQVNQGTPPGKYTVMLHGEYSSGDGEDRFASLFPDGKSSLIAEVTDEDDQTFVIDIGKRTVTKQ